MHNLITWFVVCIFPGVCGIHGDIVGEDVMGRSIIWSFIDTPQPPRYEVLETQAELDRLVEEMNVPDHAIRGTVDFDTEVAIVAVRGSNLVHQCVWIDHVYRNEDRTTVIVHGGVWMFEALACGNFLAGTMMDVVSAPRAPGIYGFLDGETTAVLGADVVG